VTVDRAAARRRLIVRAVLSGLAAAALAALWWWAGARWGFGARELVVRGRRLVLPHPAWLGALAALPWLWLVKGSSLADLPRAQQWLSLGVRAALVAALAAALTGAAWVGTDHRVCTVVLVDVSDSVPDEALGRARAYVEELRRAAGADDTLRLVTFAGDARAVTVPADRAVALPAAALARHAAGAETDVQAALRFAYGLFPPAHLKRVVVVSDGAETRGAMLAEADLAASFGIKIFTRAFPDAYRHEVAVRAVRVPPRVRLRAPFELQVDLFSTDPGVAARLVVYRDGVLDHREALTLAAGTTTVRYQSEVFEAGLARYEVKLELDGGAAAAAAHDTFDNNNRYIETVVVRGKPQILYVEGTPAYAGPLRTALEAAGMAVDVRGPAGLPDALAELARFDAVIVSDVAAELVTHAAMGALEAYVREGGGGLLFAGGEHAFGPGGWRGTKLERLMPVSLDVERRRDTPSLAIELVIDKSGSMEGPKIEAAKEAAKAVVEMLGGADLIGVVTFDATASELVPLDAASNRFRILGEISRLSAGGGTNIVNALALAHDTLRGRTAMLKHMILLSDGLSGEKDILAAVEATNRDDITVSAVGVGDDVDRALIEAVAAAGGGRPYMTRDPSDIPRIFVKETETVTRNALVERPGRARLVKPMAMVEGVPFGEAPDLLGWVATRARPGADLVLDVPETGDPLLASWRVGLGKVAAWTSDVKPRWSVGWLSWSGYGKFWGQVVRDTMRHGTPERFDARVDVEDGAVHVVVDAADADDRFVNGLASRARLFDPADPKRAVEVDLHQTAAGRYEATIAPPGLGSWVVEVTHRDASGATVGVSRATASLPYPRETLTLEGDRVRLAMLAARTGGAADAPAAAPWAPAGGEITTRQPLWPWVALAAVGLFVLDVALRRVRLWERRAAGAAAGSGVRAGG
jgi:uncharacterized membrane protein